MDYDPFTERRPEDTPLPESNDTDYEGNQENIELQNRNENLDWDNYENDGDMEETSFITPIESTQDIIDLLSTIEDPILRERMKDSLQEIDLDEKIDNQLKIVFTKGVEKSQLLDELDTSFWDGFIISDEQKKFLWQQKVNNLNNALVGKTFIDASNKEVFNFIEQNVNEILTKENEIKGYIFRNKKIVTFKNSEFSAVDSVKLSEFVNSIDNIQDNSAQSALVEFLECEGVSERAEVLADEYIRNLREEQKNIIESIELKDLQDIKERKSLETKIKDLNFIEKEIKTIKKNGKIKIRLKVISKSILGSLKKLGRFLNKNRGKLGLIGVSVVISIIGIVIDYVSGSHYIHKGLNAIKKATKKIHDGVQQIINDATAKYYHKFTKLGVDIIFGLISFVITIFSFIVSGSLLFGMTNLIAFVISVFNIYIDISPTGDIKVLINNKKLDFELASYTVIGLMPPEKIIVQFANHRGKTVEEVRETIEKTIKVKKVRNLDYIFSKIFAAAAKVLDTGESVVEHQSLLTQKNAMYLLVGALVIYMFMYFY